MAIRGSSSQIAGDGNSMLVDKLIGTAYATVKAVRDNLDKIGYLVQNMSTVQAVAENIVLNKIFTGKTSLAGQTVNVQLDGSFDQSTIVAQSILVIASSGAVYGAESGYFTAWVQGGELYLKLSQDVPVALTNATIKWTVFYEE